MKGKRVELRVLGEADAPALWESVASSREALKRRLRWAGSVSGPADEEAFVRRAAGGGERVWAVAERKSDAVVGVVALRSLSASPGLAELSGWIRVDRAGKGYGSEAFKLALAQAFKGDALQRVWARIDPSNRGARRILQKLGFKYEGCLRREKRLNGRWVDQECWGLLREEWKR